LAANPQPQSQALPPAGWSALRAEWRGEPSTFLSFCPYCEKSRCALPVERVGEPKLRKSGESRQTKNDVALATGNSQ
jgi:hypothetical protein